MKVLTRGMSLSSVTTLSSSSSSSTTTNTTTATATTNSSSRKGRHLTIGQNPVYLDVHLSKLFSLSYLQQVFPPPPPQQQHQQQHQHQQNDNRQPPPPQQKFNNQASKIPKWKIEVLGRYEAYVDLPRVETARQRDEALAFFLKQQVSVTLEMLCRQQQPQTQPQPSTTLDCISVSTFKLMLKCQEELGQLTEWIQNVLPSVRSDLESSLGYGRYEMGATWLRNDFVTFIAISNTTRWIQSFLQPLGDRFNSSEHLVKATAATAALSSNPPTTATILGSLVASMKNFLQALQAMMTILKEEMHLFHAMTNVLQLMGHDFVSPNQKTANSDSLSSLPSSSSETCITNPSVVVTPSRDDLLNGKGVSGSCRRKMIPNGSISQRYLLATTASTVTPHKALGTTIKSSSTTTTTTTPTTILGTPTTATSTAANVTPSNASSASPDTSTATVMTTTSNTPERPLLARLRSSQKGLGRNDPLPSSSWILQNNKDSQQQPPPTLVHCARE